MGTEGGNSFEKLFEEYGDRLFQLCYRLSGNRTDAEDLAQEVLLLVYRRLPQFRGASQLSTWLYRIAQRRWQRMRRPGRPATVPLDERTTDRAGTPAGADQGWIDQWALDAAIQALPEPLRVAVLLVKVEGLTGDEAARVLGIPLGTVRTRVRTALRRLRRALLEMEAAGGESGAGKEDCPPWP